LNASFTGSATPGRANVTFTVVPGDAAQRVGHLVDLLVDDGQRVDLDDRSPSRTPPSSAGVCGNTRLTTTLVVPVVFCSSSSIPTPPYRPPTLRLNSSFLLGREQLAVRDR
jgi:hypothetical protein